METHVSTTAEGLRIPEAGVAGGIVPAPPSSSSYDGPSTACTAGAVEEMTTAKTSSGIELGAALCDREKKEAETPLEILRAEAGGILHTAQEIATDAVMVYHANPGRQLHKDHLISSNRAAAILAARWGDLNGEATLSSSSRTLRNLGVWDNTTIGGTSPHDAPEVGRVLLANCQALYGRKSSTYSWYVGAARIFLAIIDIHGEGNLDPETIQEPHSVLEEEGEIWETGRLTNLAPDSPVAHVLAAMVQPSTGLTGGAPPEGTRTRRKPGYLLESEEEGPCPMEVEVSLTPLESIREGVPVEPPTDTQASLQENASSQQPSRPPSPVGSVLPDEGRIRRLEEVVRVDISAAARAGRRRELRRDRGRPRLDGSGPYKSASSEVSVSESEADKGSSSSDPVPLTMPSFTGAQRKLAEKKIRRMERGTSAEVMTKLDKELRAIEKVRQRAKNLKGELNGKLKLSVYALREAIRTLAERAGAGTEDPGFWRSRVAELTAQLERRDAKLSCLSRQMSKLRAEVAELRAGTPTSGAPAALLDPAPTHVGHTDTPMVVEGQSDLPRPSSPVVLSQDPIIAGNLGGIRESLCDIARRLERLESRSTAQPRPARTGDPASASRGGTEASGRAEGKGTDSKRRRKKKKKPSMASVARAANLASREAGTSAGASDTHIIRETEAPGEKNHAPPNKTAVGQGTSWTEVVKKGGKKKKSGPTTTAPRQTEVTPREKNSGTGASDVPKKTRMDVLRALKKKVPRTEAITIRTPESTSLPDVMRGFKKAISLKDIGIEGGKIHSRRGFNGDFIIEVSGEQAAAKADRLVSAMKMSIPDRVDVEIRRPKKTADLRLHGLDESIAVEEIQSAVAEVGGCSPKEIKVGNWGLLPRQRSLWIQCPQRAAIKAAEARRISIGWSSVRVEPLQGRPTRCFRCLARGHTQQRCPSTKDRSRCCHNCGQEGHTGAGCKVPPRCPVCQEANKPANHRAGSAQCPPIAPKWEVRPRRGEMEPGTGGEGATKQLVDLPLPAPVAPEKEQMSVDPVPVRAGSGDEDDAASTVSMTSTSGVGDKRRRSETGNSPPQGPSKKKALPVIGPLPQRPGSKSRRRILDTAKPPDDEAGPSRRH